MATLTSQLLVRLVDGVSGPARAADAALRGLNAAALGDGAALRRARHALTDPRVEGREFEVIDGMIAAGSVEDALRQPTAGATANAVVPFRRKDKE